MAIIFRISERATWEEAQALGFYTGELHDDGFIHMSERCQVIDVANHHYNNQKNLLLLAVDTEKLNAEVRYEKRGTDEPFPHVYGVINIDAVVSVAEFLPNVDGLFEMPEVFSS
jgi:uncharacterized protein (DUF952 family)